MTTLVTGVSAMDDQHLPLVVLTPLSGSSLTVMSPFDPAAPLAQLTAAVAVDVGVDLADDALPLLLLLVLVWDEEDVEEDAEDVEALLLEWLALDPHPAATISTPMTAATAHPRVTRKPRCTTLAHALPRDSTEESFGATRANPLAARPEHWVSGAFYLCEPVAVPRPPHHPAAAEASFRVEGDDAKGQSARQKPRNWQWYHRPTSP